MTFAMMWTHGDAIVAAADGVVTWNVEGPSGPTALGQSDTFRGHRVTEAALKVAALYPNVLVTGAGDGRSLVKAIELLQEALHCGCSPEHSLTILVQSGGGKGAILLMGTFVGGKRVIYEVENGATIRRYDGRVALVAGSLPGPVREDLKNGALNLDPLASAEDALTGLQTSAHLVLSLEPGLFREGIGGVICGMVLREDGFSFQHPTTWIFGGDDVFVWHDDGMRRESAGGMVFSVVGENLHFVTSTFYSEPLSERIFVGVPCTWDDATVHAWADEMRPRFYEPDVIVFLNLNRKVACVIPHAKAPACPVKINSPHPGSLGFTVVEFNRAILDRTIRDGVERGILLHFYQWWLKYEGEAGQSDHT